MKRRIKLGHAIIAPRDVRTLSWVNHGQTIAKVDRLVLATAMHPDELLLFAVSSIRAGATECLAFAGKDNAISAKLFDETAVDVGFAFVDVEPGHRFALDVVNVADKCEGPAFARFAKSLPRLIRAEIFVTLVQRPN